MSNSYYIEKVDPDERVQNPCTEICAREFEEVLNLFKTSIVQTIEENNPKSDIWVIKDWWGEKMKLSIYYGEGCKRKYNW